MTRPTLVSLAQELGVSRQTVSNVINAPHLVRTETRERVQAAIAASGYRPNVVAQSLRSQRSRALAIRVPPTGDGINGVVMDRFLHHLVVATRRHGYRVTLLAADDFAQEVALLREMHLRGTIDGCVLTDSHAADDRQAALTTAGVPHVTFGRPWTDAGGPRPTAGCWVDVDGAAGTRAATRMLLDRGHTRIGFLGWPELSDVGNDRKRGWLDAMTQAGHADRHLWHACPDDRMASGLEGMEVLRERGAEAVVCASDSLAVGALECLRRSDALTGDHAPVVGFDNTPVARALGISSLDQPVEGVVDALCDSLVRELDEEGATPPKVQLLEPTLVERSLGVIFSQPADATAVQPVTHN